MVHFLDCNLEGSDWNFSLASLLTYIIYHYYNLSSSWVHSLKFTYSVLEPYGIKNAFNLGCLIRILPLLSTLIAWNRVQKDPWKRTFLETIMLWLVSHHHSSFEINEGWYTCGSATDFIVSLFISFRMVGTPKTRNSSPGLAWFL